MLRVLMVASLAAFTAGAQALAKNTEQAEMQANELQDEVRQAMQAVDGVDTSKELPSFEEAARRAETLTPGMFPQLGGELTGRLADADTQSTIGELMDKARSMAAELGLPVSAERGLSLYVFVSFSMPDASLKALIEQGELAGAPVVLRGLVNNSIAETMATVRALYDDDRSQESGAVIDPTLFQRFGIDQVPAVVVAEQAAKACTLDDCATPKHVKIAGDVPLRYALERISMAEPEFRGQLQILMNKLEPGRNW